MTFTDYAAIIGCSTIAGAALLTLRFIATELLALRVRRDPRNRYAGSDD